MVKAIRPDSTITPMTFKSEKPDRAAWLKGGETHCNLAPSVPARPRRIVLLGTPGGGKDTQAELLAHRLSTCHLATGDVFRDAKKLTECDRTPTMIRALEHMRVGELVPDEIILNLIVERSRCLRCKGGFILDGFPRTIRQAGMLDQLLTSEDLRLDVVLHYELPVETVVARVAGRRLCSGCQAVFHLALHPPKRKDYCDHCGTRLEQREDDRPECIRVRMQKYQEQTAPLVDFYRQQEILLSLSAEGSPEEVFERTLTALQKMQS